MASAPNHMASKRDGTINLAGSSAVDELLLFFPGMWILLLTGQWNFLG
jgi:hypothetical protein